MAPKFITHIPDIAAFKSSTKGFKSRKSVKINKIDSLVIGYHTLPKKCSRDTRVGHLQKMKAACETWIKEQGARHKNRKLGVEALIGMINVEMGRYPVEITNLGKPSMPPNLEMQISYYKDPSKDFDLNHSFLFGDLDKNILKNISYYEGEYEDACKNDKENEEKILDNFNKLIKAKTNRKDREKATRYLLGKGAYNLHDRKRIFNLLSDALKQKIRKGKYNKLKPKQIECVAWNLMHCDNAWKSRSRTILTLDNLLELTFKIVNQKMKFKRNARIKDYVENAEFKKIGKKRFLHNHVVMAGHGVYNEHEHLYPEKPLKKFLGQRIELQRGKIKVPRGLVFHFYCPYNQALNDDFANLIEGYLMNYVLPEPYESVREGEYVDNYYLCYPHRMQLNVKEIDLSFNNLIRVATWQRMKPLTELLQDKRCAPPSKRNAPPKEIHWLACRGPEKFLWYSPKVGRYFKATRKDPAKIVKYHKDGEKVEKKVVKEIKGDLYKYFY